MNIEYHEFYSEILGKEMPFKSYGHAGKPIIVFPSSGGRFYEYEDFGMIEACQGFIESGYVRFYAVDSIDNESWLNKHAWAGDMANRHNQYDTYITDELIPFVKEHSGWQGPMIATGCSMGGYHSANFYFRHPDVFDTLIALSGIYDIAFFVGDNVSDTDVYLNSPVDYLSNIEDENYLAAYRNGNIIICTGQGNWEEDSIRDTRAMDTILKSKGIPAWVDYWGQDVNHDWPWWRIQMQYFLKELKDQERI
ncbi:esterase family protein [Gudongella sp. DL1XJH-153]|uniref:esterase family protein n=1 Tax=Gudongella sp. DL1XJH-153 TaxID=3409804 RepID=UPI003BB5B708